MSNLQKILNCDEKNYDKLFDSLTKNLEKAQYFCPTNGKVQKTEKFLSEKTKLVTGYADLVLNDKNAYKILFDNVKTSGILKNSDAFSAEKLFKLVQNSVFDYFGSGRPNDELRTQIYRNAYLKEQDVSIKNFQNSGNSMCLERASLAHNFLLLLGVKDELVSSDINLNGQKDLHTFNIATLGEKRYIFDLVCSKVTDLPMPSPIMQKFDDAKNYNGEKITFKTQSGKTNTISYDAVAFEKNMEQNLEF